MTETEFVSSVNNDIFKAYKKDNDSIKDRQRCLATVAKILDRAKYREFLREDLQSKIDNEVRPEYLLKNFQYNNLRDYLQYCDWVISKNRLHRYCIALNYAKRRKAINAGTFLSTVMFDAYSFNTGEWVYNPKLGEVLSAPEDFCYNPPIQ